MELVRIDRTASENANGISQKSLGDALESAIVILKSNNYNVR